MKKLVLFLISLLCCSSIFAGSLKEIVFIGDSLSDNGNLYASLKIIPKSPPYFKGRFTNGPTWAEYVGKYFYDRSYIDSQIYAWGGATAILHNPVYDKFVAPITLDGEMYTYFLHSLFKNKSKVLYIIWIGANDYLYDQRPNMDELADEVVNKISWAVTALIDHGARNFMILNLPDLSRTPFARAHNTGVRLNVLSQMHNKKLANAINALSQAHPEAKIMPMNIFTIFNDLIDNTEKYNQLYRVHITNLRDSCWMGGMTLQGSDKARIDADLQKALTEKGAPSKNFDTTAMSHAIVNSPSLALAYALGKAQEEGKTPCRNADEYIFWDQLHPTQVVHQILAQIVEKALIENGVDV